MFSLFYQEQAFGKDSLQLVTILWPKHCIASEDNHTFPWRVYCTTSSFKSRLGSILLSEIFTSDSLNPSNLHGVRRNICLNHTFTISGLVFDGTIRYKIKKNKTLRRPKNSPMFLCEHGKFMKVQSLMTDLKRAMKEKEFRNINILNTFSKG